MRLFITGGLGFVGRHLTGFFLAKGHEVSAVDLAPESPIKKAGYRYFSADTTRSGAWQEAVGSCDAVLNLAGANIFKRWNQAYKKAIYDSRILTTRQVVEAIPEGKEFTLLSTSAGGYYGFSGDEEKTEDTPPGRDFLARVCVDWEKEAFVAREKGARVAATRFGVVFGRNGGAFQTMKTPFQMGVGGPMGSGEQWFSWIHEDDLARAFEFLLENPDMDGPVNFAAPNPLKNRDMAAALGRALHRPAFMKAPAFAIRLAMGELGENFLNGQRMVPAKLTQHGFQFQHPHLEAAVRHLLGKE